MGIVLLVIGLMLVSTGIKNTQGALSGQLKQDFSGAGNFWYFIFGLFAVGALGYYSPLKTASRLLIVLILLVLILSNQGFFAQLQSAIATPAASAPLAGDAAAASGKSAAPTTTTNGTAIPSGTNMQSIVPGLPGLGSVGVSPGSIADVLSGGFFQ